MANLFDLTGRVAIITGGAGLLGEQHARVIAQAGGIPVLVDVCYDRAEKKARAISEEFGVSACAVAANITDRSEVEHLLNQTLEQHGRVDILVNNAANNPRVEQSSEVNFSRFEHF